MNVTVLTVAMGLVLTHRALTFVPALLATSSTLTSNNALVKFNHKNYVRSWPTYSYILLAFYTGLYYDKAILQNKTASTIPIYSRCLIHLRCMKIPPSCIVHSICNGPMSGCGIIVQVSCTMAF